MTFVTFFVRLYRARTTQFHRKRVYLRGPIDPRHCARSLRRKISAGTRTVFDNVSEKLSSTKRDIANRKVIPPHTLQFSSRPCRVNTCARRTVQHENSPRRFE